VSKRDNKKGQIVQPVAIKRLWFVILFLSVVGFGVSVELSFIHYYTHTNPSYKSVCAINEQVNCETVAQSPLSVALGLPISAWGLLAYSAFGILAMWGLSKRRLGQSWPAGIVFLLSQGALGSALALAYISFFYINAMCIFCLTLYVVNSLLWVFSYVLVRKTTISVFKIFVIDFKSLFGKPVLFASLLVLSLVLVALVQLVVPAYWHHPAWDDLPKLSTGVDDEGHNWIGAENPIITVMEFSDYECPHCRRAHKTVRAMLGNFKDTVRLVHRHQPLDQACNPEVKRAFHGRACEFSKAVECAAQQDAFWEMNDAVFTIQSKIKV